jgi:hypothetical protein
MVKILNMLSIFISLLCLSKSCKLTPMDDIRRPYRGERRDYAIPSPRPAPRPTPAPQPPHHQVHHRQALHSPAQPAPTPTYQSIPQPQPVQHHPHHQAPRQVHHAQSKPTRRLPAIRLNKQIILATVLAGAAIFGGYLLLKPEKQKVFTPASLAKQASFSFYYPSPLPSGYSYVNNINAFEGGQAYYMIGNGNKHIIVHEQPASGDKLNTKSLSNPVAYTAAGGQAALGNVAGQPAGLVLSGSTLVTINTTGDVPPADLATTINNLHLVNR